MKKFLLFAFILISVAGYGQFTKGTRTLGFNFGGVGYSSRSTDDDFADSRLGLRTQSQKDFSINFNPSYGVFLTDKLLLGGGVSISYNRSDVEEKYDYVFNSNRKSTLLGLNFYGRNYFAGKNGLYPYAQGNFGVSFGSGSGGSTLKYVSRDSSIISNFTQKGILSINAGLSGGATKMLNKNLGIDFAVGYNFNMFNSTIAPVTSRVVRGITLESGSGGDYKSSNTTNGFSLNVGLIIFLDPKK